MIKIKLAQRKLTKAIRALDPEAGRVARRNARGRVFAAIKSLECAIDAEFELKPKAKKPETLKAMAERLTPSGFRRKLMDIAPEAWDPGEVQLFTAWILDTYGLTPRPVALSDRGHGIAEDLIEIDARATVKARHVQLWLYLGQAIARVQSSAQRNQAQRVRDRAWVRGMFRVAEAWGATEWREHLTEAPPALGGSAPVLELRALRAG